MIRRFSSVEGDGRSGYIYASQRALEQIERVETRRFDEVEA
jgi:hypothetical protein